MKTYPGREYVILPASEVGNIDFSKVLETSANTLRYSTDNEYTFVKYEGEEPEFLEGKTKYTYIEFLEILNDTNGIWYRDNEEI